MTIDHNAEAVSVRGQFFAPAAVALEVGANCAGISFEPQFIHAGITPLLLNAISVAGISAQFSGTFTPAVAFDGASTGITYHKQIGLYQWNGKTIGGWFEIMLTSKGSGTGAATITGLPVAAPNPGVCTISRYSGFNSAIVPIGDVSVASTSIDLLSMGAGSVTPIVDVDFSNTSLIKGWFSYPLS